MTTFLWPRVTKKSGLVSCHRAARCDQCGFVATHAKEIANHECDPENPSWSTETVRRRLRALRERRALAEQSGVSAADAASIWQRAEEMLSGRPLSAFLVIWTMNGGQSAGLKSSETRTFLQETRCDYLCLQELDMDPATFDPYCRFWKPLGWSVAFPEGDFIRARTCILSRQPGRTISSFRLSSGSGGGFSR